MEAGSSAGSDRQITVVIVDDEALVRTGFTHILNAADDITVVATADGHSAIDVINETRPDVVLLDVRMPGKNGLEVLAGIHRDRGRPVVAMLTTFDTDEYIASALARGASGFLVKDTDPAQLPQLVRTLFGGGVVLSPTVSSAVISGYLGRETGAGADAEAVSRLTKRERQVLVLLAEGRTNTEIAEALFFSVGTVKSHVSSILAKLEVKSRIEAALVADRARLLG